MTLDQIETPAALIDRPRMMLNIERMQAHMNALGVAFRPHVKTSKCVEVARAQRNAGARGITVSTLKEAEQFFAAGFSNILYAVGMVASKLPRALALKQAGCDLKLIADNIESAQAVAEFGRLHSETFEVWIEIDTDGHRSGVKPDEPRLIDIGHALNGNGARLGGVLTHAGSSYELNTPDALAALAEQERAGCVHAAERLRKAGLPCDVVSVGSTPTALAARHLEGVTEVRAGVYVFFDLVMRNIGVCDTRNLALSVLTTVIGHQADKGWAILDAGWMAMSRDRGTAKQAHDYGYGQPCTLDGSPLEGYTLTGANQEHGILANTGHADTDIVKHLPVGTRLLILPNHACATGAQYPAYHARSADDEVEVWDRFYGW
ncbi:alanine racemase [Burkholderia sp. Leaf177]|uniref:DSD1 family PLP-dependent enzyme n=1 Tax=Burkholderia sp. Leaf177 TaxID=1736287 RepID=UPI0006F85453|nr:DSD1 family PLP-dependent enzyme [Burkholderia sp. Leaf177]KQR73600.1 alanine racemase [Burkholderia sp. Leaf177]